MDLMGPGRDRGNVLYTWTPPPKVQPAEYLRTVTVVGEAPNAQGLAKYDTRSGQRLKEWAGGRELPWWNIHDALPARWSVRVARSRVQFRIATFQLGNEPLLLLGRRVCDAFDLPKDLEWLEWYGIGWHRHPMIAFPHPSPRNRWYNVEENRQRAAELVRALAAGELPRFEKGVKK